MLKNVNKADFFQSQCYGEHFTLYSIFYWIGENLSIFPAYKESRPLIWALSHYSMLWQRRTIFWQKFPLGNLLGFRRTWVKYFLHFILWNVWRALKWANTLFTCKGFVPICGKSGFIKLNPRITSASSCHVSVHPIILKHFKLLGEHRRWLLFYFYNVQFYFMILHRFFGNTFYFKISSTCQQ
jgi:hypothetical protein